MFLETHLTSQVSEFVDVSGILWRFAKIGSHFHKPERRRLRLPTTKVVISQSGDQPFDLFRWTSMPATTTMMVSDDDRRRHHDDDDDRRRASLYEECQKRCRAGHSNLCIEERQNCRRGVCILNDVIITICALFNIDICFASKQVSSVFMLKR